MSERVLSPRALNRALLARQFLLERSGASLTTAIERVAGLQTQYAPSAYVALWARLQDFRRDTLTRALERRRVIQATLMRETIHMVSRRDFPLFAAAVRRARRDWRLRLPELRDIDMDKVATLVRSYLAGGPSRARDIEAFLRGRGYPKIAWNAVGVWVDMVRVPPSGTWEHRRADLYGLAEDWVGSSKVTEQQGQEHLVRRYLGGFGPASVNDIASWTGMPITPVRSVINRLRLRRFRAEDGSDLLDLTRSPLPDPDTPAPVRFLPTWDPTLLVHARRTQILPERYRDRVFNTRTPHSISTVLIDGAVAGTWRFADGRVSLELFDRISRSTRKELDEEAERLAAFHSA